MANFKSHYLVLAGIILLGGLLRFWHLDLKPLWLDEVITALFALGRNYNDVPLDTIFPLQQLPQIFSFKTGLTCLQIAQNIATQSTHPPLFFCLIHGWLQAPYVGVISRGLVWSLRSLPALLGIGAIAALYWLNTIAFSRAAGLLAAALIAVSPFAVYLSQEARHYTLPVLLIALSLVGLIHIQKLFFTHDKGNHALILIAWISVNIVGFYTHYFFILAFVAQVVTLCVLMYWRRGNVSRSSIVAIALSIFVVIASFIPWLPILASHFNRSETSWLPEPQHIAPIYQTLASWVLMLVALPVENQPWWIAVVAGFVMLVFSIWVSSQIFLGFKSLWRSPATQLSTITLLTFTTVVLLEILAIVYFLGKDITIAPRYNFVYYPGFCALVAASLVARQNSRLRYKSQAIVFMLGLISCGFVISNFVFQKPFNPQQVAQNINLEPTLPLVVVVGYDNYQDVALGLSFALALEKMRSEQYFTSFGFFKRLPGYESVWQKLATSPPPSTSTVNLWIVAPGLRRRDYPPQLVYANHSCNLDSTQHYRIGIPYQLYRCKRGEG